MTLCQSMTDCLDIEHALRRPSVDNVDANGWQVVRKICYRLARQARHDVANHHAAVLALQSISQMSQSDPQMELPEQFQPQRVIQRLYEAEYASAHIGMDAALMAQAGNETAYASVGHESLIAILQRAVADRLPQSHAGISGDLQQAQGVWVIERGDMLHHLFSTLYFLWSPGMNRYGAAESMHVEADEHKATIILRYTHQQSLYHVAQCLSHTPHQRPCQLNRSISRPAGDFAICICRHIVAVHGGVISLQCQGNQQVVSVTLPLSRPQA